MEWLKFKEDSGFLHVESYIYNGIPFLRIIPRDLNEDIPTVIYYHGWMSSKENMRFQAMTIATYGYQVILPDALYHGDRGELNFEDPTAPEKHLWEIMINTLDESTDFIGHIIDEHNADRERICIVGSSMGGITAGGIFVKNENIKLLAGFNSSFSWRRMMDKNNLPHGEGYEKTIDKYDLNANIDAIGDRRVLMLNGIDDTAVSIEYQRQFLKDCDSDRVELIEFSEVGHRITSSMVANFITWLNRYL